MNIFYGKWYSVYVDLSKESGEKQLLNKEVGDRLKFKVCKVRSGVAVFALRLFDTCHRSVILHVFHLTVPTIVCFVQK